MAGAEQKPWTFPAKAYGYAIDRMRSIQVRRSIEGDEMLRGWDREYSYHAFVKALIERVDQESQEKDARADKGVGVMRFKSINKEEQDEAEGAEQ
jgi:hypothetical protein